MLYYLCFFDTWFNPFTAPACKISGLKDARTRLQTVYFGPTTSSFNAMCFEENSFICQCEKKKETETVKGFKFGTFIAGRFQVTSWQ